MKKLLKIMITFILTVSFAFSVPGTLHLIYTNGQAVEENGNLYYDFDIQIWLSEGNEILSSGMAYVQYPVDVFGQTVVMNNKVNVTRTGILDVILPDLNIDLYDVITNDTYSNCFAVTFDAYFAGNNSLKQFYEEVSTDPLAPSDLFNIRIDVAAPGTGYVLFPSSIPGTESLYFNFYYQTFDGGLDYSQAIEVVDIEEDVPGPEGSVNFQSLTAGWKKNKLEIKWTTRNEVDLAGYVLTRSSDGVNYTEIASYVNIPGLAAKGGNGIIKYDYVDETAVSGASYMYQLACVDIYDNVITLGSVQVGSGLLFNVAASYPNPFNPSFTLPFELYGTQEVDIRLYNASGQLVRHIANGNYPAGQYAFSVHCDDLSSGVYILKAMISGQESTQKMLLVK